MLVYAHRGASRQAPENTLSAFSLADRLGSDGVELDVRRTGDGHLVILHDAHLGDGRALVDLTLLDLPSEVPSLAEALDACRNMIVNIEIKNSRHDVDFDPAAAVVDGVVGEIRDRDQSRYLISSFDRGTLRRWREGAPDVPAAYLYAHLDATEAVRRAVEMGMAALHPYVDLVDAELMAAANEASLDVNVWTVDDPQRMLELRDLGCAGICTNVPDIALTTLGR